MNLEKRFPFLFFILIFSIFLLFFSIVHAEVDFDNLPSGISVSNVYLEKDSYFSKEVVSGTVILSNGTKSNINGAILEISLIGSNDSEKEVEQYDDFGFSQVGETFSIKEGEVRVAKFDYVLPEYKPSRFIAMKINLFSHEGIKLGSVTEKIEFEAEILPHIVAKGENMIIGKNIFDLSSLLILYKNESARFIYTVTNKNDTDIRLDPLVTITDINEPNKIIARYEEPQILVENNNSVEAFTNLRNFNNKPGFYQGKIDFFDEEGRERGKSIYFHYVIDGPIAFINSISVSQPSISFGQYLNVLIDYSGKPLDVRNPKRFRGVKDVLVDIVVQDSRGRDIMKQNSIIDLESDGQLDFELFSVHNAKELRVLVVFSTDGVTIAQKSLETEPPDDKNVLVPFVLYGFYFLFFISILLFILTLFRKIRHKVPNL